MPSVLCPQRSALSPQVSALCPQCSALSVLPSVLCHQCCNEHLRGINAHKSSRFTIVALLLQRAIQLHASEHQGIQRLIALSSAACLPIQHPFALSSAASSRLSAVSTSGQCMPLIVVDSFLAHRCWIHSTRCPTIYQHSCETEYWGCGGHFVKSIKRL